jgi:hypothetical protein
MFQMKYAIDHTQSPEAVEHAVQEYHQLFHVNQPLDHDALVATTLHRAVLSNRPPIENRWIVVCQMFSNDLCNTTYGARY